MADEDVTKLNVSSDKSGPSNDTEDPFSDIKKELATRFELLPEELKKVITDDGYQLKLFNIAKGEKLTYEELGSLEMETTMVLLGMTKPADYRDELQVQLKKNDTDIDRLVDTVNTQVFGPIKAELEKLYATKKEPADFIPESIVSGPAPVSASAPIAAPTTSAPFFSPKPQAPIAAPTLSYSDKSVLEKTGVVITETPTFAVPAAAMPNRTDVLKGIENPPKAPNASIVADKFSMSGPTLAPSKTTDYTLPKAGNTPPASAPKPLSDPYRESIG